MKWYTASATDEKQEKKTAAKKAAKAKKEQAKHEYLGAREHEEVLWIMTCAFKGRYCSCYLALTADAKLTWFGFVNPKDPKVTSVEWFTCTSQKKSNSGRWFSNNFQEWSTFAKGIPGVSHWGLSSNDSSSIDSTYIYIYIYIQHNPLYKYTLIITCLWNHFG